MPRSTPKKFIPPLAHVVFAAGTFPPAETVILTGVTESTLQNWTNKGYLGEDKLKLGRGAKRRYSLSDLETILFAKDMVDVGIAPLIAFEYATEIQKKTAEAALRIRDQLLEEGYGGDELEAELSNRVIELLAGFAANPGLGSSTKPFALSIYHGGRLQFQHIPDSNAVLLLRVGSRKLGLASHIAAVKRERELKKAARPIKPTTEEQLLQGLEQLSAARARKGKP